jgi:hypothetical protein
MASIEADVRETRRPKPDGGVHMRAMAWPRKEKWATCVAVGLPYVGYGRPDSGSFPRGKSVLL